MEEDFQKLLAVQLPTELKTTPLIADLRQFMAQGGGVLREDLEALAVLGAYYFITLTSGTQQELVGDGFGLGNMWQTTGA